MGRVARKNAEYPEKGFLAFFYSLGDAVVRQRRTRQGFVEKSKGVCYNSGRQNRRLPRPFFRFVGWNSKRQKPFFYREALT